MYPQPPAAQPIAVVEDSSPMPRQCIFESVLSWAHASKRRFFSHEPTDRSVVRSQIISVVKDHDATASPARQPYPETVAHPTPPRVEYTRDPQETQRRLLEAGLNVFGRKGYAAASVNEIVRQAGCSKGAFYCHFASKEDFFFTILEHRLRGNMAKFQQQCPWQGDCGQWLLGTLQTMASFTDKDPSWRALSVEFMAHGIRDARVGQRIAEMHQLFRQFLADTLRQSEACRSQRMAADPEVIAATVTALLDGMIMHSSMEPQSLPVGEFIEHIQPLLAAWFAEP